MDKKSHKDTDNETPDTKEEKSSGKKFHVAMVILSIIGLFYDPKSYL